MARFFGRWLSDSLTIALALAGAVVLMQAPAFTADYAASLLQVTREVRQEIEQREESARRYYAIPATDDDGIVAALRQVEPSNAETLTLAVDKARALQAAYDRIDRSSALVQPVVALRDLLDDAHGYKRAILRTLAQTYQFQLMLTVAAAVYGVVGLLIGSFLAQLVHSLAVVAVGGRRSAGGRSS